MKPAKRRRTTTDCTKITSSNIVVKSSDETQDILWILKYSKEDYEFKQEPLNIQLDEGTRISATQVIDLNKDGHSDLIVTVENEGSSKPKKEIKLFIYSPKEGKFEAPLDITDIHESHPEFLIADVNSNSKPDILYYHKDGHRALAEVNDDNKISMLFVK